MWQAEEGTEMHTGFLWEKQNERDNLEDLGVDVRVILKPVLKDLFGGCGMGPFGTGYGHTVGSFRKW